MTLTIFIIFFLLLSALFSGTEIAFISANKLGIELKRKRGSRRGSILAGFYEKPAHFLGTMLVGNNIALVAFSSLLTVPLRAFFESMGIVIAPVLLLINTIIITIIVLIFGEFLPKTIFRLYANDILYFLAYPLRVIQFLLFVPSLIMTFLTNLLLKYVLKAPIEEVEEAFTRLDLEDFIKGSRRKDTEEDIDTELFEKALNLKKIKVKDCLIPRTEIKEIDVGEGIEDLKTLFIDSKMSRIIVTKGDIDNIMGYVHHQQLLEDPKNIKSILLETPIVPEAMRVDDLMNKFIKERINIAWVVDEYGGTAGIITMEDILEEIFGEIEDEHDLEDYVEIIESDNEFIFAGRLEIAYLNEKYDLGFPEGENYSTLSGYLVMTTEEIPEQGAEIELDGYRFVLELVSETKIETVRVIKLTKENEEMDQ